MSTRGRNRLVIPTSVKKTVQPKISFSGHSVDFKRLKSVVAEALTSENSSEARVLAGVNFQERIAKLFNRPSTFDSGLSGMDIMFVELLICMAYPHGRIFSTIDENPQDGPGALYLYSKKVKLTANAHLHLSKWNEVSSESAPLPDDPKQEFTIYFFENPQIDPYQDSAFHIAVPLVHTGTVDFLESVTFSDPSPLFLEKLAVLKNLDQFDEAGHRLKLLIFGSMVMSLYGVFSSSNADRPKDIDLLYPHADGAFVDKFGEIVQTLDPAEESQLDIYAAGITPDIILKGAKACAMDRFFGYFQSTVNAGPDVIYVPNRGMPDPNFSLRGGSNGPFSELPLQKIQTNSNPGTGPRMLLTFEDLVSVPSFSVMAYGWRFLCLDAEIFGKHLSYLDRACGFEVKKDTVTGMSKIECPISDVPANVVSDLLLIRQAYVSGKLTPPFSAGNISLTKYLNYLGLDGELGLSPSLTTLKESLSVPLHYNALFTSVSNERAYELWKTRTLEKETELEARHQAREAFGSLDSDVSYSDEELGLRPDEEIKAVPVMITRPSTATSNRLEAYCKRTFVTKYPSKVPELWRKSLVLSFPGSSKKINPVTGEKLLPYVLDTYTRRNDALSALVYTHQKLFRNVDLLSLPPTPIGSIYGDLPSTWIWILTVNGNLDVMLVTSGFELFNKHMALAFGTDRILAGGELRIQRSGDIIFSITSGTYTAELMEKSADTNARYESAVKSYFTFHLTQQWWNEGKRLYFTEDELIPVNKKPLAGEFSLMCSGFTASNRLYVHNQNNKDFYLSQASFEEVAGISATDTSRKSEKICEDPSVLAQVVKEFESAKVLLEDVDVITSGLQQIGQYGYQIFADSAIAVPSFGIATALADIVPKNGTTFRPQTPLQKEIVSEFLDFENWSWVKVLSTQEKSSASNSLVVLGKLDFDKLQIEELTDTASSENLAAAATPSRSKIPTTVTNIFQNHAALKLSMASRADDMSAEYEILVYRVIYDRLISTRICYHIPSIIFGLTGYTGYNFRGLISPARIEKLRQLPNVPGATPFGSNPKLNVLMTEWITGKSLGDVIAGDFGLTTTDLMSILFQTAYTVSQLAAIGVQQNDMHPGNVYIHRLPAPTYLSYFNSYSSKYYLVPARYLVKIYDFDQATSTTLGPNKRLESRPAFGGAGIYNRIDTRFDLFTLLCTVRTEAAENKTSDIFSVVNEVIFTLFGTTTPTVTVSRPDGTQIEKNIFASDAWPFICRACGIDPATKKCYSKPDVAEKFIPSGIPDAATWMGELSDAMNCVKDLEKDGFPRKYLPPHDKDLVYFFGAKAADYVGDSYGYSGLLQFAHPGKNRSQIQKLDAAISVTTLIPDAEVYFV